MAEELKIDNSLSKVQKYELLVSQVNSLISSDEPLLSGLSNFTAVLKQTFEFVSWVGFYFIKAEYLYLGPFQGNIACVGIKLGKGVCGTAASERKTVLVTNVNEFPGHIACDSNSKSEIVVPLIQNGETIGVLDLDSYEYSSFDEIDKKYLEQIVEILIDKFDFLKFKMV